MRYLVSCLLLFIIVSVSVPAFVEGRSERQDGPADRSLFEPGKILVKVRENTISKGREYLRSTGIPSFDEKLARYEVDELRKTFKHRAIPDGSGLPDLSRIFTVSFPAEHDPVIVARVFSGKFVEGYKKDYVEPLDQLMQEELSQAEPLVVNPVETVGVAAEGNANPAGL